MQIAELCGSAGGIEHAHARTGGRASRALQKGCRAATIIWGEHVAARRSDHGEATLLPLILTTVLGDSFREASAVESIKPRNILSFFGYSFAGEEGFPPSIDVLGVATASDRGASGASRSLGLSAVFTGA